MIQVTKNHVKKGGTTIIKNENGLNRIIFYAFFNSYVLTSEAVKQ